MSSEITKQFYSACRNGSIEQVHELLPTLSLEQINEIHTKGSTALHAACYHGHKEIVKLLLDRGARRTIKNEFQCFPYDEAKTDEIRELFTRRTANRFAGDDEGHIDWVKCDKNAEKIASEYRVRHRGFGWDKSNIEYRLKVIKQEMHHAEHEEVKLFLNQALLDPYSLLRAYTVESPFYVKLNEHLAAKHFNSGTNFGITYFIDFFYNHPTFEDLSYIGEVYRGMTMTDNDLKQYQIGGKVMNKAFMSTSKDKQTAQDFAQKGASNREKKQGGIIKISVFCTYQIRNKRTGLSISGYSEYKNEQEVLVGPYSAFIITDIQKVKPNYFKINLQECDLVNLDDDGDKDKDDDDDDD